MSRPGIELRTSDLRVKCPTDCATRPGELKKAQGEVNREVVNKIRRINRSIKKIEDKLEEKTKMT